MHSNTPESILDKVSIGAGALNWFFRLWWAPEGGGRAQPRTTSHTTQGWCVIVHVPNRARGWANHAPLSHTRHFLVILLEQSP